MKWSRLTRNKYITLNNARSTYFSSLWTTMGGPAQRHVVRNLEGDVTVSRNLQSPAQLRPLRVRGG